MNIGNPETISSSEGAPKNEEELKIDMLAYFQKISPIEGVFDPGEEVKRLRSVPREQRQEAVAQFKDKLYRQTEAWALCRSAIEKMIESELSQGAEITKNRIVSIISQFGNSYGFSETQLGIAYGFVDKFLDARKNAIELREKYPDKVSLINMLTGMKFNKDQENLFFVEIGPMSIDIFCPEEVAGMIHAFLTKRKAVDENGDFIYGGFAPRNREDLNIYYTVINMTQVQGVEDMKKVLAHERQHAMYKIFRPESVPEDNTSQKPEIPTKQNQGILSLLRRKFYERIFRFERNTDKELLINYKLSQDVEERKLLLEEYMKLKRRKAFESVKDEIFAFFKSGDYDQETFMEDVDEGYDYLKKVRKMKGTKRDKLWQDFSKRILVDEYQQIILEAGLLFSGLISNYNYGIEEAIALMTDIPLSEWRKKIRAITGEIEKRKHEEKE